MCLNGGLQSGLHPANDRRRHVRSIKTIVVLIASCLAARTALAADGILIVEKTTNGAATHTSQIQIEKNRMRAEVVDQNGAKQLVVFDGAAQIMRLVDLDKKTYVE